MLSGNLITLLAVGAIAAAPAAYVGHNFGYGSAQREARASQQMMINREIFLWHELGAARQAQYDLIEQVETLWDLTGTARRNMAAALAVQKRRAEDYKLAATAAIKRLDMSESQDVKVWKDTRVPDELALPVCLSDDAGCRTAEAGADTDNDLEVRSDTPED